MSSHPEITFQKPADDTLLVRLTGEWTLHEKLPSSKEVEKQCEKDTGIQKVLFDPAPLAQWDSGLLVFLTKVIDFCAQKNIRIEKESLPQGVQKLLALASPENQREGISRGASRKTFLVKVADATIRFIRSSQEMLAFIGEAFLAFMKLLRGKASFRGSDLLMVIQDTGAQSLPIVSLISILVGLILAFVGAIQLELFGAQIYVANIVGIGMTRVMGAIMTGVIMAGRTGASFAAQLGTMQVNEEIDALRTSGISPMEFLVLPRMLALTLMMPLLCLYSDFMGILGGLFVGVTMLDLNLMEYYYQTKSAVTLTHFWVGLFHSAVFGVLVALSGCLRGMQCGRSASAVGYATTSAVVTGIVSIVIATAIITFGCNVLGI
ncbi:MAG: ABC transporter permease [Thermodesulfovibrionales bacterium]|nr:ABC transporter permease [Thermodesulfovibrionales bacterium]